MFCKIETQILIELLKVNYYLQKKIRPFTIMKDNGEIDS